MGKEQQITSGYKGFKYAPAWSPDSKKLAWSDKDCRLWYVDINEKKQVAGRSGKVRRNSELLLVSRQQVAGLRQE